MGWLCFFAFACQSYSPKTLDPQVTAGEFGKRSLEDPGLRTALIASGHWKARQSWPPAPWGLRPLQGAGLHYSPDIAVAKAQAQSALAAIGTADTTPNPSLAFAPELGTSGGVASPWVLGFSLNFPIETAGKRQLIVSQARAQSNAAVLGISEKAWAVISGVRSSLLDLEAGSKRLEILNSQRENDAEIVAIIGGKIQVGESPRTDLGVYQTQQSRNLVDLADGRSKLETARARLADAIGVPAISLRGLMVCFGPLDRFPAMPSTQNLRKAALLQRTDLLGLLENYAAADAGLRLEIARQYPDLNLNPGYTFDQGQAKWALGIGLSLPIDRNLGPIREAIAKREEAAAIFERQQIKIRGELDQSLAAYNDDRTRLRDIEKLLADQEFQLNAAEKLNQAGEADRLGIFAARSLVLQTSLVRIDALLQAQQSLGKLADSAQQDLD